MSDTADLTNLASSEETTFFNENYWRSVITMGLVMLPLMMVNGYDYYTIMAKMADISVKEVRTHYNWNQFTRMAWGCMIGGNATWNGFLWVVWVFSFIPHRFFQHSMFWSIVVSVTLAFLNLLVYDIFFIVGYFMEGGQAFTLVWAFIHNA